MEKTYNPALIQRTQQLHGDAQHQSKSVCR